MTPGRHRRTTERLLVPLLVLGLSLGSAAIAQAGPGQAGPDQAGGGPAADATVVDSTGQPGRTVALTFDDGPDPRNTPRLLDLLGEHHVQAVFCLWGQHVRENPELVRRIVSEGHVLCNHTMRHENMSTWSPADIRANLRATNEVIHEAAPGAEIRYFRAPYGAWGGTPGVAADMGMQPLGWSLSVADWNRPGTDVLVRRLMDGISQGGVVLLHDGGGDRSQTVEAVSRVIPRLRDEGWRFTLPARSG
ncbi:Peptidoglycan/xylan/chitin deacetylase, PgdA/CDA1 family [Actinopolyspora mzabensis]|uniref:Peptidoglycan/xylan/chitin deacetylase, PgdA/CDA1 family n=1 Tax=Actinopolyspora mzabensis TaxID=995066 RepID=A0A1G9EMB4_ACTMZ|nr:polysaccharide deacetylase family protein [Actinopolyspora mzabensis]SDK77249.1 Peptidoglycan/xylan/chitin deacetylase, PgdA/CDA1 family [Actinopolyspora mzabensis]